jgi:exopolysaccharide biosynthesis polyprenyl glycosylphosphotransferase
MSTVEEGAKAVGLPEDGPLLGREPPGIHLSDWAARTAAGWLPLARAIMAGFPVVTVVLLSAQRLGALEIAVLWALSFLVIGDTRYAVWLRPLAPRLPLAALYSAAVAFVGVLLVNVWSSHVSLTPLALLVVAGATFVVAAGLELTSVRGLAAHKRILIVGAGEAGSALLDELRRHPTLHPGAVRMVHADARESFEHAVLSERPDVVVTATDATEVVRSILDAGLVHVRVIALHGFYEHVLGRVPVDELSPSWFMSVVHLYQRPYSRLSKRAFDCVCAVLGLVLLAPLFGAAALLVRVSGGRSILYRQVRLGERGSVFQILKFRTMVEGAELPGAALWAHEDDPRITWAGRLLRRTHIDELPQLWNVLRGEMSIVGPRPERPEFLALLEREVPFWTRRHLVKPGITGWAQVQAGYASDVASAKEKLSYDLYYLKHRSLTLDLAIAAKTLAVALCDVRPRRQKATRSFLTAPVSPSVPHGVAASNGNGIVAWNGNNNGVVSSNGHGISRVANGAGHGEPGRVAEAGEIRKI